MAHSPTPWRVDPRFLSEVQTVNDETISSCWHEFAAGQEIKVTGVLPCSLQESAANAAFIVRAVNAFEANEALIKELVETLEPFAELAQEGSEDHPDDTVVATTFGRVADFTLTLAHLRRATAVWAKAATRP